MFTMLPYVAEQPKRQEIHNFNDGQERESCKKTQQSSTVSQEVSRTVQLVSFRSNELHLLEEHGDSCHVGPEKCKTSEVGWAKCSHRPLEFAEVSFGCLEEPLPFEVGLGVLRVVGQWSACGKAVAVGHFVPIFIWREIFKLLQTRLHWLRQQVH